MSYLDPLEMDVSIDVDVDNYFCISTRKSHKNPAV